MSIPSSWYFCLESSEIRPNQVLGRTFFGQELVFWRTESGILHCSTAACPHRGSDLSKLGRVQGENLECFSHRYQHDAKGDCVKTGLPIVLEF